MLIGLLFDKALKRRCLTQLWCNLIDCRWFDYLLGRAPTTQTYGQICRSRDIDIKTAIIIGLIQCLALIPGTFAQGSTIIGSLFCGYHVRRLRSILSS